MAASILSGYRLMILSVVSICFVWLSSIEPFSELILRSSIGRIVSLGWKSTLILLSVSVLMIDQYGFFWFED